jgi:uncharacterized protein (TIGR00369 family)
MKKLPHTHSCFACGESNPNGLKLRFETDGRIVQARFSPGPEHIGFRNTVHGGLISTVLDEIMVWACAVQTKKFVYCAELTVRFIQPLCPGATVRAVGQLVTNRKNRIFEAKGELLSETGQLVASGTGKYLPIKDALAAEMAADFVGDYEWVLR